MTFNVALSGMNAASTRLAVTSNNIANSNTTGFKESRVEFGDVFSAGAPAGKQIGAGVRLSRVAQQFDQGDISYTNRELDFAIQGGGFFTLMSPTGPVYSRAGSFNKDKDGFVINPAGQRLQVYQPSATGEGFDSGRMTDLRIATDVSAPKATAGTSVFTTLPAGASVPANAPFNASDSKTFNHTTSMEVYDSLGAVHTQTLYYVKTANPNEWQVYGQFDDNATADLGLVQYTTTGNLDLPATGTLTMPTFTPPNGAEPMDVTVDIGKSVQYGKSFVVNSLSQDGNTTGEFTGVEVNEAGVITARYSNGVEKTVGQLAMTRFENEQGLKALGNNAFAATAASGVPTSGSANTSGFGAITGGALESSTVDMTAQLIEMIQAQRSFQANSQVIGANDEVLQTAVNLGR